MGDGFNGKAVFFEAKASSGQDFLIAGGVKVCEAAGEFELVAVDRDGTVGALAGFEDGFRDVVDIDGQEPTDAGVFIFQVAAGLGVADVMDPVFLKCAENKIQHVVKMDANIGGNAARFFDVALPGMQVPVSTGKV